MGLRARRFRSDLVTCLITDEFTLGEFWEQRYNKLFDLKPTGSEAIVPSSYATLAKTASQTVS